MEKVAFELIAMVVAGGVGSRVGAATPKQYLPLAGRAVLAHSLACFTQHAAIKHTFCAVAAGDAYAAEHLSPQANLTVLRTGGASRAETVLNSLYEIEKRYPNCVVLVHDAARPNLQARELNALIEAAQTGQPAILATPVSDTLKKQATDGVTTLDRQHLWAAQTPQAAPIKVLIKALSAAQMSGLEITDEASALEAQDIAVRLVPSSRNNFKITTPEDYQLMQALFQSPSPALRIGEGMDVHALVLGRPLILGGVHIPHHSGLLGHSDADAVCHALTDALLGAAGLGDIGAHFPDSDPAFKGADSVKLLQAAYEKIQQNGWRLSNADITIIAQQPKLAPHLPAMRQRLANSLGVRETQLNLKAKTNEKLGFLGRQEGIEVRAVVMICGT